jgi:hypothetical protein
MYTFTERRYGVETTNFRFSFYFNLLHGWWFRYGSDEHIAYSTTETSLNKNTAGSPAAQNDRTRLSIFEQQARFYKAPRR